MRLTILNQFYAPDLAPTGQLATSLAEHRAAADEVTVLTSRGTYVTEAQGDHLEQSVNPRVIRFWSPGLGKRRVLARLAEFAVFHLQAIARLLIMPRQDVIVSLTTPPFIAFAALAHKIVHRDTRLVLWNMDCYPEMLELTGMIGSRGIVSRILQSCNRFLFKRLDHLVCLDEAMRDLLLSRYAPENGSPPASVIPNWERLGSFPAQSKVPAWEEEARLGLKGRFVVLYLGNAGFGHSFETVLAAAERLQDQPVTFLFVGGGEKWPQLAEGSAASQVPNLVLHGYVPKEVTPAVMAAANCGLVTIHEGALGVISPSKIHANLAMGLPLVYVGPQGGNVDEAIRRFDCGVSLRPGDVNRLVEFIERLLGDSEEQQRLRDRARSAFETAYNDRVALARFDAILDSLRPSAP